MTGANKATGRPVSFANPHTDIAATTPGALLWRRARRAATPALAAASSSALATP